MKIVYCINNTWYSGGMTRVLANKVNYLVNIGYHVTIITTDQLAKENHYPMSNKVEIIDLGINYLGLDVAPFLKKLIYRPIKMLKHWRKLSTTLCKVNADIVISMYTKDEYILPMINDNSKKILEMHTSRYNLIEGRRKLGLLAYFFNKLDDFFINKYDKFVVQTNEDKAYWKSIKEVNVIPNANTFQGKIRSSLQNKVALAVGRYSHQKRFDDLIEVWREINKKHPDWHLHIVGDGEDREKLQALVVRYKLNDVVFLKGQTNLIEEIYLNSSMYLLSSRHEGLGMVLLEAQAFGLPLISYACPCGPSEIIENNLNGFLIEDGDIASMVFHVDKLIKDFELRKLMGSRAFDMSNRFSENKIMNRWTDLFQELVK